MRYLVAILLASLLASCTCAYHTRKAMAKCGPLKQSDSVLIQEKETVKYRDTVIYITQDGPRLVINSPCDSLGNLKPFYREENKHGIIAKVFTTGKDMHVECDDDSLKAVIKGLQEKEKIKVVIKKEYIEKPVRIKTWWDSLYQWWFWISVIALFFWCFFKKSQWIKNKLSIFR